MLTYSSLMLTCISIVWPDSLCFSICTTFWEQWNSRGSKTQKLHISLNIMPCENNKEWSHCSQSMLELWISAQTIILWEVIHSPVLEATCVKRPPFHILKVHFSLTMDHLPVNHTKVCCFKDIRK